MTKETKLEAMLEKYWWEADHGPGPEQSAKEWAPRFLAMFEKWSSK